MRVRFCVPFGGPIMPRCFWVECSQEEAENCVFPYLQESEINESKQLTNDQRDRFEVFIDIFDVDLKHTVFFMISPDLSFIKAAPIIYPFSSQWNAYNPFRKVDEQIIRSLEELMTVPMKYEEYVYPEKAEDMKV